MLLSPASVEATEQNNRQYHGWDVDVDTASHLTPIP